MRGGGERARYYDLACQRGEEEEGHSATDLACVPSLQVVDDAEEVHRILAILKPCACSLRDSSLAPNQT